MISELRSIAAAAERTDQAVRRTGDSALAMSRAIRISGGSPEQAGALGGMARLNGDDPNSIAEAAREFRERLASSPMAQAMMGRGVLPAATGQLVNESELYLEAQRRILTERSNERARILAQVAGLERLLPLREADARLTAETLRTAELRGRMVDADLRRDRANLRALRAMREENSERTGIAWEKMTMGWRTTMAALGAGWAQLKADVLSGQGLDRYRFHQSPFGVAPGNQPRQSPMQANTGAMQSLTEELIALRKDFLNGRDRTAGAFPRNLRGRALNQALESAAFDLGAVTF